MTQDRGYLARTRLMEERERAIRVQRQAMAAIIIGRLIRAGIWGLAWFAVGFAFCYMLYTTGVIQ
jgi:hypothetical protein